MPNPLSVMFSLLLLVAIHIPTVHSMNLRGTVLDRKGNAVYGAVVSLRLQGVTDTTDYQGSFSFISANVSSGKTVVTAPTVHPVRYVDGAILLENPVDQKVVLALFDLQGRLIGKLHNGNLNAGSHRFVPPEFSKNQTFLLYARTGSVTTTCRCIGSSAPVASSKGPVPGGIPFRSAEIALEMIDVSHATYNGTTEPVSSLDDSLTIRLFPKVDFKKSMTFSVGDTFYTSPEQIILSLDSINDGRCGCNAFCEWEGNAALYFNLSIQDKTTGIVLGTYDKKEVAIGGYTIRLMEVYPSCPSSQKTNYRVTVAVYPTDTPAKTLFLEHYTTRDGKAVSGTCASLCIDFPTYFFNSNKQELRYN